MEKGPINYRALDLLRNVDERHPDYKNNNNLMKNINTDFLSWSIDRQLEDDQNYILEQRENLSRVSLKHVMRKASKLPYCHEPGTPSQFEYFYNQHLEAEILDVNCLEVKPNVFIFTARINHPETHNHGYFLIGKRGFHVNIGRVTLKAILVYLMYQMLEPKYPETTGIPHRPSHIYLDYSFRHWKEEIASHMNQIGVSTGFETKENAQMRAAKPGKDYLNRMYRKCSGCIYISKKEDHERRGLRLMKCANCKEEYYCTLECQASDWEDHRESCIQRCREIEMEAKEAIAKRSEVLL